MSEELRDMRKRATMLAERAWQIQQECLRLDFTKGGDETAKWVADQLLAALVAYEQDGVFS